MDTGAEASDGRGHDGATEFVVGGIRLDSVV
jgi:hypothetical protein